MIKSNQRRSTARKPLADISNGGKPSRLSKKKNPASRDDDALDRLLLVRSELSDLVGQIDELVAQALQHKTIGRTANQDIESFGHVLSDMHSSLKPWLSRFKQSFSGPSTACVKHPSEDITAACTKKEENTAPNNINEPGLDLIVSPSPLVSWRAGACTVERGKHLFLLTPLPKPKMFTPKCPGTSKSTAGLLQKKDPHTTLGPSSSTTLQNDVRDDVLERVEAKQVTSNAPKPHTIDVKNGTSESILVSPLISNHHIRRDSIFMLTPCFKASPLPKSYSFLDQITENIPEPTQKNNSKSSDDIACDEASESLASRYPFSFQPTCDLTTRRREVDETLDWFLSPPKTCVLMEPSDEKPVSMPMDTANVLIVQEGKQPEENTLKKVLWTPMRKDVESTVRKGKQPGENTLKKELWTRFEAASTTGLSFDASIFQKTERKGFLDMLEEVSCETSDTDCRIAR